MAVEKMMLAKMTGKIEKLDGLIAAVCTKGIFQPERAEKFISGTYGYVSVKEENNHAAFMQRIEELAASAGVKLEATVPESFERDENGDDFIIALGEGLAKLEDKRRVLEEQLKTCENAVEQYRHFVGLGIDLDRILESKFIKFRFGHMPASSIKKLAAYEQTCDFFLFIKCSSDDKNAWGVYLAPHGRAEEADEIFAKLNFEKLRIPAAVGTPEKIIEELEKNINILNGEIENIKNQALALWSGSEEKCKELYSRLSYLSKLHSMRSYAAVYKEKHFFYVGWVPKSSIDELKEAIGADISVEFEEPDLSDEELQPPVKLKNKKIFRPFEYIIEMFGMPSADDVDVTSFVAVTYTAMFGLMFGDLGQGFVLAIAGFVMWKFMHMAMGKVLIPCGISAMLAGFAYGSFFGYEHALDPVYHALGMAGKPVEVMDSINGMLLMAIGIGIALLVASMLIFAYKSFKNGRVGEAIFSQNGIAGIVLYLSGVCFVLDFMGAESPLPKPVFVTGMLVSIVIIFFKSILIGLVERRRDWKPESIGDFILENAFEIFEYILSFFSNTVSFLRISAFVLVHSGMMMAVFAIAGENENIVVVILGNILVMALEALFVSIQAMRLEFYELFSRCYTGEGNAFEPARLK